MARTYIWWSSSTRRASSAGSRLGRGPRDGGGEAGPASDPDAARLWGFGKAGHRADMGLLAASFAEAGMLPDGRDTAWATATLYVLIGPETWHLLRVELQRAPDEYSRWLRTALVDAFDVPDR